MLGSPSLLPLPTALVHFLGVELLPVWGFGGATFTAAKNVILFYVQDDTILRCRKQVDQVQQNATFLNHAQCVSGAVGRFMITTEKLKALKTCPGCASGILDCHNVHDQSFWTNVLWTSIVLTSATVLATLCAFASRGLCCKSFGSGAYLLFTWELETRCFYKVLVGVMLAFTAFAWGGVALVPLWEYMEGDEPMKHAMQVVEVLGFAFITQIICLKKLLKPPAKIHLWNKGVRAEEFASITFRRSWKDFVGQNNDVFSSLMVDALWCAEVGQEKNLEKMLPDDFPVHKFMTMCSQLQLTESSDKEGSGEESVE